MKRRGFLGGLFSAGAVAAVPMPAQANGVTWRTACVNPHCRVALEQFVDLSGPVSVGVQCPKCLWMLDTSGLSEQIFAAQGKDKYGRQR